MPELVLPLIGGGAAEKTQSMAVMVKSLRSAARVGGSAIRLAGPGSSADQHVLHEVPVIQGHTPAPQKSLPRAHPFVRGSGRGSGRAEWLVHALRHGR
ncbi:hypothetical protein [Streptomyces achromogenes]|uniref:hypothetical protein n=1 Tax=Streptomyces achromogenes TaxID=67255 RepID=UPI0036FEC819